MVFDVYLTGSSGDIIKGTRNTVRSEDEAGALAFDELLRGAHHGNRKVNKRKGIGPEPMHELSPVRGCAMFALIIRTGSRGMTAHEALYEINSRGGWLSDDQKAMAGLSVPSQYQAAARNSPDMAREYGNEYFWEYERAHITAAECVVHLAALGLTVTEEAVREARMRNAPLIARHVCGYGVALYPL